MKKTEKKTHTHTHTHTHTRQQDTNDMKPNPTTHGVGTQVMSALSPVCLYRGDSVQTNCVSIGNYCRRRSLTPAVLDMDKARSKADYSHDNEHMHDLRHGTQTSPD